MSNFCKMCPPVLVWIMMAFMVASLISCGDDDDTIPAPRAAFDFSIVDATVTFTNLSEGADSFRWDFGDDTGTSEEANPIYTYTATGTYTVALTAINAGGEDTNSTMLSVVVQGGNLVINGDFEEATGWNERQIWNDPDNGVEHGIVDGAYFWKQAAIEDGGAGWSNYVIWQEIEVEAGATADALFELNSKTLIDLLLHRKRLLAVATIDLLEQLVNPVIEYVTRHLLCEERNAEAAVGCLLHKRFHEVAIGSDHEPDAKRRGDDLR